MSEETPSASAENTNDEDEESVMDEDTVVADVPPSPTLILTPPEPTTPLERPTQLDPNSEVLIS